MTTRIRKPGSERREEVARAVLSIIGERGITSLTTATVAHEIGVTSGALFRHFASRDEMLEEAVRFATTEIDTTFPGPSLPPIQRIRALAQNRVQVFASNPGIGWLLRSDQAHLALPSSAVKQLQGLITRSKRFLLQAIRDGAAEGNIRSDIEPEVLLVTVMGTIHALVGMAGVQKSGSRPKKLSTERVLTGLERMLAPSRPAKTTVLRKASSLPARKLKVRSKEGVQK